MRYNASITIPANTLEADAIEQQFELCFGTISQVAILFPPGHAGLTYLQIFYQTRQIFPTTKGQSFRGDDTQYIFAERWPIFEPPFALALKAWNLDDTYEHTVHIAVSVLVPEMLMPVIVQSPTLPEGMLL